MREIIQEDVQRVALLIQKLNECEWQYLFNCPGIFILMKDDVLIMSLKILHNGEFAAHYDSRLVRASLGMDFSGPIINVAVWNFIYDAVGKNFNFSFPAENGQRSLFLV